jgi:hypothetical protein
MTIKNFMKLNLEEIKKIISEDLPNDKFDSYEFIRRFAKKFEIEYVNFLSNSINNHHRTVHSQIARNLAENQEYLKFQKNGKIKSETVFGYDVPNEEWVKV